ADRVERADDADDRAEQADVRARVADRREEREVVLEPVHLAELRHAHRAARAFDELVRRETRLLLEPSKLAEPRLEDPGHAERCRLRARDLAVQVVEVPAGPERLLELAG